MNLEEISKIVAFMKENGVAELSYENKGSSLSLRLEPNTAAAPARTVKAAAPAENPFAEEQSQGIEVEFADAVPMELSNETLKAMAKEAQKAAKQAAKEAKEAAKVAAKEARAAAKAAAKAAKEAMKSEPAEAVELENAEPDMEALEAEVEIPVIDIDLPTETEEEEGLEIEDFELEEETLAAEEPVARPAMTIDTEALKANAKQAAAVVTDAATTAAKVGMKLGIQGLNYLREMGAELAKAAEAEAAKRSAKTETAAPAEAPAETPAAEEKKDEE